MNFCNYDWNLASLYAMKSAMLHIEASKYLLEGAYTSFITIYMYLLNKEGAVANASDNITFQSVETQDYAYYKKGWISIIRNYLEKMPCLAFLFDSNEKTQVMLYGGAKK
jgi:hypothetical protein